MNREIINKAKLLMNALEPGMVIDIESSEFAVETLRELIDIARKDNCRDRVTPSQH